MSPFIGGDKGACVHALLCQFLAETRIGGEASEAFLVEKNAGAISGDSRFYRLFQKLQYVLLFCPCDIAFGAAFLWKGA